MHIVVAMGTSAFSKLGEGTASATQLANLRGAVSALADVAREHKLVLVYGNERRMDFDICNHSIEQEMRLALPAHAAVTILTQTTVGERTMDEAAAETGPIIDKDLTAAVVAEAVGADRIVFLTDVDGVYRYGRSFAPEFIARTRMAGIDKCEFAKEPMAPKIDAACRFVRHTGRPAFIGNIIHARSVIAGTSGTRIDP
jgi:carbamate kinase